MFLSVFTFVWKESKVLDLNSNMQWQAENDCLELLLSFKSSDRFVKSLIKRLNACQKNLMITDRPDIVMVGDGVVYGIEHFKVSSALADNSHGERVVFADNDYRRFCRDVLLYGRSELEQTDFISDEVYAKLCVLIEESFKVTYQTTYFDYYKSFERAFCKHVEKVGSYRENIRANGLVGDVKMYFLIEIYFPFDRLHLPVSEGCITRDILDLFESIRSDSLLDGLILIMRDIIGIGKYSVFFVDLNDYQRSIKRQRIEQNCVKSIFMNAEIRPIPEISFVRNGTSVSFIAHYKGKRSIGGC